MRLMVAGAGAFGREHLIRLAGKGGLDLAVADIRPEAAAAAAAQFGLADHDADAAALLRRFAPDGVVVATPAAAHAGLATEALARGVPVLVEKPVTPTAAEALALAEAAAASRAFLLPGHVLRFSAQHRIAADLVRAGTVGALVGVASRRYRDEDHARRYPDIDPVLMTLIHDIDLALWFDGGEAVRASASRLPRASSRSVTSARLESSTGAVWHLATGWIHPAGSVPADRVELVGTEGSIEFEAGGPILVHGRQPQRIEPPTDDDPLRNELDGFLAGIRAGRCQAPVTPRDAVNGLIAAEMILASLRGATTP